ncbi:MAG: hypothetical protein CLLPBCKN_007187 [Chroococcidiopsis cubana SAG 39.79]|uniref:Uncharacterized protein n=1 Tax=Chroococcidiopsis cubana SAG 39.79 TaxID=388085 RepID=A0AB37URY8_9CYAN|nr:hypothetical protein [Chroococcidiopsis cubana]MDZ4877752.1 hypothetical protein [Chroococcidiopsis cubana SAG 39.79]PSB62831.1 hypothetical protein C7B79_16420 [Chroococcidiopsis cubana CCALA 043]RUT14036.1 hypothetical protein DSM107010_05190 [Chroococcidiopsis cubana SAG 39.79]
MIQDLLSFAIDVITLSYITILALEFFIDILPPQLPIYSSTTDLRAVTERVKYLSDERDSNWYTQQFNFKYL